MTIAQPAPLGLRNFGLLLMVAMLWGSNNVAAHLVTQETQPLLAAGIRFAITTMALLPWLRVPRPQLKSVLTIATVAGPLHFGLLYWGFSLTHNIGALTVVLQIWVPLSTVLAIFILHEYPTRIQLLGLGCALTGMVVMCFDRHLLDTLGAAFFCLCASTCWAFTMVLIRRAGNLNGLAIQAWMSLLTAPVLLLVGWYMQPQGFAILSHVSPRYWWLTLYSAITAGIIGNVLVFNIVRKHSVAQTTPVLLTASLFAMLCSHFFLGETFGTQEIIGAAVLLASVIIIVRGQK
jgi:O-acetylserine/cysteine efflux transporter